MPKANIIVTSVSDEGDTVVVRGRSEHAAPTDGPMQGDSARDGQARDGHARGDHPGDHARDETVAYVFLCKGEGADVGLAEQASRLARGTNVVVEYSVIDASWRLASGLWTVSRGS